MMLGVKSMTRLVNWCDYSFYDVPSVTRSIADITRFYAVNLAPFRKRFRLTVYNYLPFVSFSVPPLFGARSPSAIFGGVITIIVDSVDGVFRGRLLTHICKKIIKTRSTPPPIADSYTPTPVSFICVNIRIITASYHLTPNVIHFYPIHSFIIPQARFKRKEFDAQPQVVGR